MLFLHDLDFANVYIIWLAILFCWFQEYLSWTAGFKAMCIDLKSWISALTCCCRCGLMCTSTWCCPPCPGWVRRCPSLTSDYLTEHCALRESGVVLPWPLTVWQNTVPCVSRALIVLHCTLYCLVLSLFLSYPFLLLAHSPDFFFPKRLLFCVFEQLGNEQFCQWYVQHMLPYGLYAFIYKDLRWPCAVGGAINLQ